MKCTHTLYLCSLVETNTTLSHIQGMAPKDHTSTFYVHGVSLFYVRLTHSIQSCVIFLEKEGPHISLSSPFPKLLLQSPPLHWNLFLACPRMPFLRDCHSERTRDRTVGCRRRNTAMLMVWQILLLFPTVTKTPLCALR